MKENINYDNCMRKQCKECKYYEQCFEYKPKNKGGIIMLVKATDKYEKLNLKDNELGRIPKEGEQFEVSEERYRVLTKTNKFNEVFVEKVEKTKEVETATKKVEKEKAVKKTTTKKTTKKVE